MRAVLFSTILFVLVLTIFVAGCKNTPMGRTSHPAAKQLPPGQVKKVYGYQSAKAFAPGQQKQARKAKYKANKKNQGAKRK